MSEYKPVIEGWQPGVVASGPGGIPCTDRNPYPGAVPVVDSFEPWHDLDNWYLKCFATTKVGAPCTLPRATDTELCMGHWQAVGSMVVRSLMSYATDV